MVQVVHIDDCPNSAVAGERMRAALDAVGLTSVPVEFVLVRTPQDAADVEFAGSPTFLIDGVDVFPLGVRTTDLACRVYMTESGLAGLPTTSQLEAAIRARAS
jgi:hypothetical protein